MELEHPFLRTPCDGAMKQFRGSKKVFDKEIDVLLKDVSKKKGDLEPEEVLLLVGKLRGLKRKLAISREEEEEAVRLCRLRITHIHANLDNIQALTKQAPAKTAAPRISLDGISARLLSTANGSELPRADIANPETFMKPLPRLQWGTLKLQRILADYMLREGLFETADRLISTAGIGDLVDVDVFKTSRKVVRALANRDCSEALKWCVDNKRRLSKSQSQLEFRLRVQEFVEKRRKGSLKDAIAYARKYLAGMAKENLNEVQETMALLAFGPSTTCERYSRMYDSKRWDDLIAHFTSENYQLHGLTSESVLEITLKIGVSVVRTQYCSDDQSRKVNCPTCSDPFRELAEELPSSHHVHSALVCSILGTPMNENNPPMVLPNLNVYSEDSLKMLAAAGSGKFTDPRTGEVFRYPDEMIRKAFIM